MVRQAVDLVWASPRSPLRCPLGCERLEGLNKARVQPPPPLQQEAAIGHFVRQGVLESVVLLGEQTRLIQKLHRLQMHQAAVQCRLGHVRNGPQQREGHLRANDRRSLEQTFVLRR
jgi:hypothetical protein